MFEQELDVYLAHGWNVVSDGPSGIVLARKKKMTTTTRMGYAFGVLMLPFRGFGLLFLIAAFIDDLHTKPETVFIRRG